MECGVVEDIAMECSVTECSGVECDVTECSVMGCSAVECNVTECTVMEALRNAYICMNIEMTGECFYADICGTKR